MKKIELEVTDEMYESLMEISKGLNTQNHRHTAMPYFFQIRTDKRVFDTGMNGDVSFWHDNDGTELETVEEYRDYILDYSDVDSVVVNSMGKDALESFLEDTMNLEQCSYSIENDFKNAFLTEKACKEHIEQNSYHYNNPVDFLTHATRNPELETVMEFICKLTGGDLHK